MSDPNNKDGEPPTGQPATRRRAPTITIDTADFENTPSDAPQASQSPIQNTSSSMAQPADASGSTDSSDQRPQLNVQTSFDSRGSRPASTHNVSTTPVKSPASERGGNFLSVPDRSRSRQNSMDSELTTQDVTVVASNATQPDKDANGNFKDMNEKLMNDETALTPDSGKEADFKIDNNPFAFTPGELNKMFDPKSLAAFYKLGGLFGIEKGLRSDRKSGLSNEETHLNGRVTFEEATGKKGGSSGEGYSESAPTGHDSGFSSRMRVFKDNRLPEKKGKSLLELMWITFNDKVLILLSIAAAVSLAVGLYQTFGGEHKNGEPRVEWIEGVAIIVAILIVVIVGSLNDYQKERQFAKLNKKKQDRLVRVIRSGKTVEISVFDILVGDVVHLEPGDLVPVDGILIDGFNVKCDESQATGESDIIRKRASDEVYHAIENYENLKKMDPFIQSGARIMEGIGTYMATSTGVYSSYGRTMMALNEDPEMTPLQAKLNVIATWIAKIGSIAGLLLFVVLFIEFLVRLPKMDSSVSPAQKGQMFLNIFIVVVTIIVVAVPEGLPLAVTLALAFATTRMLKDANLVRHLKACEVMGNATNICSDKTGTLTQNKMQVVSGTLGTSLNFGRQRPTSSQTQENNSDNDGGVSPTDFVNKLSPSVKELLSKSISLNSTAFEGEVDGEKTFIGSKTETAMLLFASAHLGMGPVSEIRESVETLQLIPFDSGRKYMGIVVRLPDGKARFYIKGASEIILDQCTQILADPATDESTRSMSSGDKDTVTQLIDSYASRSLRTIGIAYRDFDTWPPKTARRGEGGSKEVNFEDLSHDLVFIGMVGIQDPLREGVPEAVKLCQNAGVTVRMVTGDNKLTAQAIATDCGILTKEGTVMEGPEFRNLGRLQQLRALDTLQVLARSSPDDKRVLVRRLKEKNEIVAVTGDGTNDAPALKTADVGFSMGIAGTEVAKEASSIILMDDNFTSIVKALKWGRAVNDAVKRFLQFQLTVNITAVVLTFITAVSSGSEESVLTAVQLLWVNLIMDTLAALALATDPPQESILDRKPEPRTNFIVTPTMWKMIIGQAIYQLIITLLLYYGGPRGIIPLPGSNTPSEAELATLVFNTFVWMQIFNQWNNRRLDNKFNIFEGLTRNWFFICISALMCGGQVLIIFVGGHAFSIAPEGQSGAMWGIAIFLGFLSIPVGILIRLIPDHVIIAMVPSFLKRKAKTVPGFTITDEEMGKYPEPLADVRDELNFLRRMKGGRLNNLKFAIQHPREAIMGDRSPALSRANSVRASTPSKDDSTVTPSAIPDGRRSRSDRSRSNSALGAPTVMAGIVAAGVAAGWSPVSRAPTQGSPENPEGSPLAQADNEANGGGVSTEGQK